MAALTAQAITGELKEAWKDVDEHGVSCSCCERYTADEPGFATQIYREVIYAIDRYRPGEVLTDETDESIDELADRMTDAAVNAARETITRMAAEALAGRVARLA